jgi:hypothetical protein
MGRIFDVGNNQKPLRRGGVWVIAREHLQRSDRLNNACAIGICLQDCKWLKFAEWRLIEIPPDTPDIFWGRRLKHLCLAV